MIRLQKRLVSGGGIFAILLLALLAGCTTPRREPKQIPSFVRSYANGNVNGKLGTLSVRLNLRDCIETCVMTKTSMTGTSTDRPMPFKKPVEREFSKMITSNFCVANANSLAKVELKVEPLSIDMRRDFFGTVFCNVKFSTKLLDPVDGSKRPFFESIYQEQTRCKDMDEKHVPACLYEAIQRATRRVVDDVAEDPELMGRLEDMLVEGGGPNMNSFSLKSVLKGKHYHGTAYVDCNSWDKWHTYEWAMKRIRSRCNQEPDISRSNYSIITTKEHDDVTRQWDFSFDVFVWNSKTHFMMLPNNASGHIGRCVLQLPRPLRIEDPKKKQDAEKVLRGLISRELKRRDKSPLEVRLDKLELDEDDDTIVKAVYECVF